MNRSKYDVAVSTKRLANEVALITGGCQGIGEIADLSTARPGQRLAGGPPAESRAEVRSERPEHAA